MTIELKHEEVLEIIGIDKTKKDMIVLGALLKAQKEPSDFINFETLREQLAIDEGSRKGKDSLIYRSLSWLEKEGFLKIDRSGHKHGYNSSIGIIEKALERIVLNNSKTLNEEIDIINTDVDKLSGMSSDSLASGLVDFAAGKVKFEKPIFAQGWDNIVKLITDKVYTGLTKGDVVRISLEWLSQTDYMNPNGLMNAEKIMEKGVEFRSLDHDRGEKEFRKNIRDFLVKMREEGKNLGYRILPRKDATYQFIARNTQGIVLVVSESPLSATWIPRNSNPELVDNAIESFDNDFELGTDILEFGG